jgi:predicted metallo-beta-lactamase superfamily hydrolase
MGAKSSSIFLETPDIKLLVDPGAAGMQPSYPLSPLEKEKYRKKAISGIRRRSKEATHIFVSHYHYDHHTLPSEAKKLCKEVGKSLLEIGN